MKNAFIVLNWNGWQDTLEFLDNISEQMNVTAEEHTLFLFDNGSTNDSVKRIREWLQNNVEYVEVELNFFLSDEMLPLISQNRYIFIKCDENYGFAKPNNMVAAQILKTEIEYITLCNNDVILEPNTLNSMLTFMENNPHYGCSSCRIHYYDDKSQVWHAGGFFTFYGDVLIYNTQKIDNLQKKHGDTLTVTLLTGCYLMCRSSVLRQHGLLTEDFFFGGEDINFCNRMRKARVLLGVDLSTKIYHKVNASINTKSNEKGLGSPNYKHINHFTNRMIDISKSMSRFKYFFYRPFYLLLLTVYFSWRYKSPKRVYTIVNSVRCYSKHNTCVSKELFEEICRKYS